MRILSEQTRANIEKLSIEAGIGPFQPLRAMKVALLQRIGDSGELVAIPYIIALVLHHDKPVARAAADAVHHLLAGALPSDLAWLDGEMRARMSWADWHTLNPSDILSFRRFDQSFVAVLGIASMHQNGHIREHALFLLNRVHSGEEIPYLLLRANDWVREVRELARNAVRKRLTPELAPIYAKNLALVVRLRESNRVKNDDLVSAIFAILQAPAARRWLQASFNSPDKIVRRTSYQLVLGASGEEAFTVLCQALASADPVVRIWAIQQAPRVLARDQLSHLFTSARHERFPSIRYAALRQSIEHFPDTVASDLIAALTDPVAGIRALAQYFAKKLLSLDLPSYYRQALAQDIHTECLPGAILGLSDVGTATDTEQVLPLLTHRMVAVRKAALHAITKLDGERHLPLLQHALYDESPGVSREARMLLVPMASLLDADTLWEAAYGNCHAHIRRNAYMLLLHRGKWDQLIYTLRGICVTETFISLMALNHLARWMLRADNKFMPPTAHQRQAIIQALRECTGALSPEDRSRLDAQLQGWL